MLMSQTSLKILLVGVDLRIVNVFFGYNKFTWVDNSRLFCKPLEFPVKSGTITQVLTDTIIRGRQTTREVNVPGVSFFSHFPGKKKPDRRLT